MEFPHPSAKVPPSFHGAMSAIRYYEHSERIREAARVQYGDVKSKGTPVTWTRVFTVWDNVTTNALPNENAYVRITTMEE